MAQLFTKHVLKLHRMCNSIVSNRDNTFTSHFCQELFKLAFSTVYHPPSDGKSKLVNKYLENYLRSFEGDRTNDWVVGSLG